MRLRIVTIQVFFINSSLPEYYHLSISTPPSFIVFCGKGDILNFISQPHPSSSFLILAIYVVSLILLVKTKGYKAFHLIQSNSLMISDSYTSPAKSKFSMNFRYLG